MHMHDGGNTIRDRRFGRLTRCGCDCQMDIVIATPLRLAKAAKKADFSSVQYLVFDEADKLLDQGFLQQMDKIVTACTHPKRVRFFWHQRIVDHK